MPNYIWLIGENLGKTMNNNSYYFWRQVVEIRDDIDKYLIVEKNEDNERFYRRLEPELRQFVVWRNSFRHLKLYLEADMFLVTLSYRDVRPEKILWKSLDFRTETPIIYLQHGTLALKQIGYNGKDYNNNMLRFIYYNPEIKKALLEINGFKDYQLYNGEFHPRYQALLQKNDECSIDRKQILWFVTWREYLGDNISTTILYLTMQQVISDKRLQKYLEENDLTLKLCFHSQFNTGKVTEIFKEIDTTRISWIHADQVDVMNELVESKVLITDYSSIGFDFSFLRKPVILFTPDLKEYMKKRKFYCELDELKHYAVSTPKALVDILISENYEMVNSFFEERMPRDIDYDYVRSGKHIKRMYEYFAEMQRHKVTFLGYNFYGVGGTVQATRAMAEGLLERGYCVQLLSLKQTKKPQNVPYALNMKAVYDANQKTKRNQLKKVLFRNRNSLEYLQYDKDADNLIPYAGYGLKRWLKNAKSETVISTRESLHLFLSKYASDKVKNKLYYYHCSASVFEEIFPGLSTQLENAVLGKAIFVTENNRRDFIDRYGFKPYQEYSIIGNALDSSRMICREDIKSVEEKEVYRGLYLLRLSKERREDIENLLNFGRYLKEKQIKNIVIDVFGTGDYVNEFIKFLIREELTEQICYCGFTSNPKAEFAAHDAVVDFSEAHSFGMPYIEGILNGKMVFCMRNPGSEEVLKEIPEAFFESYDELTQKMCLLHELTQEKLERNYDIIARKYSRNTIADDLLAYIKK